MIDFSRATWRKSIKSQQSGQCLELAKVDGVIGVRDSKDPNGPILEFTVAEIAAFVDGAANGEFDDLL